MSEFMTAAEMAELAEMDAAFEERDIEVITEEINFYKRQAGSAILEIGKRLAEAKEKLSHGEWLPWLEKKVAFSERSAQQYMRLWKEYGKSALSADLSISKALVLLALPESEREDFAAEKHTVDGEEKTVSAMTVKELEKAIAERNAAREEAEKAAADIQEAKDTALAAQEELARVRKELEELRSRPVEVAVQTVDASAEQIAAARLEAEKAAAAQVEKAKKTLAEAQERLRKAEEQAAAAAKEKEAALDAAKSYKAEADAARKKLAASDNEGLIKFKTLFDQTVENVNRLAELLRQQPEGEREKLCRAMQALSQQIGGIAI
nr:MAG TPA: Protein of unknown function (DUF3102) [Caudoviricetes sp.]